MDKVVIFDLDGTLIDSVPDISDNVNLTLKKFGYKERALEEICQFIGNGARKLIERSLGDGATTEQVDQCLKYYNQVYTASGSPKTKLFDGVAEMLVRLKELGYKLAILTNKPQETTNDVYKTYLQQFNFDLVVGQSEKVKCKPDKSGECLILQTLGIQPENAFHVGDGETDVQTALNAGTIPISVLWGYRSKTQLQNAGAIVFAQHPLDIINSIIDR